VSPTESSTKFPTFARLGRRLDDWETRATSGPRLKRFGTKLDRQLRKPIGLPTLIGSVIALALTSYWSSFPGGNGWWVLLVAFGGQALGMIWLVRLIFAIVLNRRAFFNRRAWLWAAPPILLITSAAFVFFPAPMLVRFELSQNAMDSFARDVIDDASFERQSYVGLWPVGRVKRTDDGMRFLVRGAMFLDEYGFAYSRGGKPQRIGEDNFVHLEGPWYLWEKSW